MASIVERANGPELVSTGYGDITNKCQDDIILTKNVYHNLIGDVTNETISNDIDNILSLIETSAVLETEKAELLMAA